MNQLQKQAALDTAKNLVLIIIASFIGIAAITLIPVPVLLMGVGIVGLAWAVLMLYRIRLSQLEYQQRQKQ